MNTATKLQPSAGHGNGSVRTQNQPPWSPPSSLQSSSASSLASSVSSSSFRPGLSGSILPSVATASLCLPRVATASLSWLADSQPEIAGSSRLRRERGLASANRQQKGEALGGS